MNEIVTKALESGLWATLFCTLFFYMLRDSRQRENRYIIAIEELGTMLKKTTEALDLCEQIRSDCENGNRLGNSILSDTHKIKLGVESMSSKADKITSEIQALRSPKERQ